MNVPTKEYTDNVFNNYFWASSIEEVNSICKNNYKRALCIALTQSIDFAGNLLPACSQLMIFSWTNSDLSGIAIYPGDISKVYFLGYSNNYWRYRCLTL